MTNSEGDARNKLHKMIEGIEIAMLTTLDDDGSLRARPMWTVKRPFDGALWFFTHASAHKTVEIEREHHVCLAYAQVSKQDYVSVSGRAELVRDRAKIDELWTSAAKVWFPKGQDDPDVALLRVSVDKAEYWDAPSGTMLYLYGLAKVALTGKSPDPGGHGTVGAA